MSIFDSAIALDKKRAAGKRGEHVRMLEDMEARIRDEFQQELDAARAARRAAETRAEAAEKALAEATASGLRQGVAADSKLAAAQTEIAGLSREVQRLNAAIDRMQTQHKEMIATPPKTSVSDTPPPPAPVAYSMDVQRGSDGLIKSVQVTPKG